MQTKQCYILVFTLFLALFTPVNNAIAQKNKFVVVLDAGHGGHDPGNLGNGYKEKDIALNIVLKVGEELEKNDNFKVIYTRKKDEFIELRDRAKVANKADADLFVSVHCNSHSSQAKGTETFVLGVANTQRNFEIAKKENEVIFLEKDYKEKYDGYDPNKPESLIGLKLVQEEYVDQSILLASLIEKNFVDDANRSSRGIKQASLWVLHNTYMPSVLVEVGFLTNNEEGKYLNQKSGQDKMAESITEAIKKYKNALTINTGNDYKVDVKEETVKEDEIVNQDKPVIGVVFKVQLAASKNKLEPKSYNFNGLDQISREQFKGVYKYYYGYTSNYALINKMKQEAIDKGFGTCYVVAFKDGKQINLTEALKTR
jgi:N-acetylmuramoyl-L-alanine amidase